jgi:hypothetical protein
MGLDVLTPYKDTNEPYKAQMIGYRSEGFDPSLIHFCVFIDLQVVRPHREIS